MEEVRIHVAKLTMNSYSSDSWRWNIPFRMVCNIWKVRIRLHHFGRPYTNRSAVLRWGAPRRPYWSPFTSFWKRKTVVGFVLRRSTVSRQHKFERYAKQHPPSSSQGWTQIEQIVFAYKCSSVVRDWRAYWSTALESDHALVYTKPSMCFGEPSERTLQRPPDCDKLSDPTSTPVFQWALPNKLRFSPTQNINEH